MTHNYMCMSLILSVFALTHSSSSSPKLLEYSETTGFHSNTQATLQLSVVFKKEADVTNEFKESFDSLNKQGIMVDVYACNSQHIASPMSDLCSQASTFYQNTEFPVYSAVYYNSQTRKWADTYLFKFKSMGPKQQFMNDVKELARNAPNKVFAAGSASNQTSEWSNGSSALRAAASESPRYPAYNITVKTEDCSKFCEEKANKKYTTSDYINLICFYFIYFRGIFGCFKDFFSLVKLVVQSRNSTATST
jgi:hypothetical protein